MIHLGRLGWESVTRADGMNISIYTCIRVCVHVCVCMYIYIYIYIYAVLFGLQGPHFAHWVFGFSLPCYSKAHT